MQVFRINRLNDLTFILIVDISYRPTGAVDCCAVFNYRCFIIDKAALTCVCGQLKEVISPWF